MNSETGKIIDLETYNSLRLYLKKGFTQMPKEGSVIRFEGTEMCFRIHRIDPKKVILKPVPSTQYKQQGE